MEEYQYTLATFGHFGCLGHFGPLWLFGPLWAISCQLCELDQEQKSPLEAQYQELMVKWRAAMEEYQYTLATLGHFGCLGHFWPLWLFGPLWAISGHLCELDQEQKSPL